MKGEPIQSEILRVKDRRYFFDVYQHEICKRLTIKESRLVHGQHRQAIVNVWEEDMTAFFLAFLRCLSWFATDELERAMKDLRARSGNEEPAISRTSPVLTQEPSRLSPDESLTE